MHVLGGIKLLVMNCYLLLSLQLIYVVSSSSWIPTPTVVIHGKDVVDEVTTTTTTTTRSLTFQRRRRISTTSLSSSSTTTTTTTTRANNNRKISSLLISPSLKYSSSSCLSSSSSSSFSSSASGDTNQTDESLWNKNKEKRNIRVLGVCGGIGSGKSMACQLLVSDLGCMAHIDSDSIAHTVYQPNTAVVKEIIEEFGPTVLLQNKTDNDEGEGQEEIMIDRKKLGAIVFADPQALSKLERMVWPHVKTEIMNRIVALEKKWQHEQQQEEDRTQQVGTKTKAKNDDNDNFDDNNNDDNDTPPPTMTTTTATTTANASKKLVPPVVIVEAAVLLDAGWEDIVDGIWVITTKQSMAIERLVQYRGLTVHDATTRIHAQSSRRGIGNLQQEVSMKHNVITAIIENNTNNQEEFKEILRKTLNDPTAWKK